MPRYLDDTKWVSTFGKATTVDIEAYGRTTSVRALFDDGLEVEAGIAPADWASQPFDAGTKHVAAGGIVVLLDRDGHATALATAMARVTEQNQRDEDVVPMKGVLGPLPLRIRWLLLIVAVFTNFVLTLLGSAQPTGYTLGVATSAVLWGLIVAFVSWLIRGRRPIVFANVFFWVTTVMASLGVARKLALTP